MRFAFGSVRDRGITTSVETAACVATVIDGAIGITDPAATSAANAAGAATGLTAAASRAAHDPSVCVDRVGRRVRRGGLR